MKCGTGLVRPRAKGSKMKSLKQLSTFSLILLLTFSCQKHSLEENFDWQGHRGARGEAPENTIAAMLKGLQDGVNTLEMDVVVTKDSVLILSHEPFFSDKICLFTESGELVNNIFQLSWEEVSLVDCGSKGHPDFLGQQKERQAKPRLIDVISAVEEAAISLDLPSPKFNIEIKSRPDWEELYHPNHKVYAQLLLDFITDLKIEDKVSIQSFDPRVLQYIHQMDPEIQLVFLTEDAEHIPSEQISELGFYPDVYSCYYPLLKEHHVRQLHSQGIQVIPWTVNEIEDAKRLIEMGVDGLITDYPAKLIGALGSSDMPQTD